VKSDRSQQSPSPQAPQTTPSALAKNPTLKDTAGQPTQFSIKPGTPEMLGEVKPDAYEYIPGQCYYRYRITYHTFVRYVPVPGKQIFMLGSTTTPYSTYIAARDTYGISGVVCWGDAWEGITLEQVVQIFGVDNVIYALYNSSQGVQHAYALGIRKFWFEEPVHKTDLTLQYTNAQLLAYDRSSFPNSVIYAADYSDVGKCGPGAYDCYDVLYNEYVAPWSY